MRVQILHQNKHYFSHPNEKLKMPGYISTKAEKHQRQHSDGTGPYGWKQNPAHECDSTRHGHPYPPPYIRAAEDAGTSNHAGA